MFSTISSYIWGGEETSEVPPPTSEAPPLTSEVVVRPQKQPPTTVRRAPPTVAAAPARDQVSDIPFTIAFLKLGCLISIGSGAFQ